MDQVHAETEARLGHAAPVPVMSLTKSDFMTIVCQSSHRAFQLSDLALQQHLAHTYGLYTHYFASTGRTYARGNVLVLLCSCYCCTVMFRLSLIVSDHALASQSSLG